MAALASHCAAQTISLFEPPELQALTASRVSPLKGLSSSISVFFPSCESARPASAVQRFQRRRQQVYFAAATAGPAPGGSDTRRSPMVAERMNGVPRTEVEIAPQVASKQQRANQAESAKELETSSQSASMQQAADTAIEADSGRKGLWVQTKNKAVFTAATESGFTNFVFTKGREGTELAEAWKGLARFTPIFHDTASGRFTTETGSSQAEYQAVSNPKELDALLKRIPDIASLSKTTTVVEFKGWKVIPAENLVAAFDGLPSELFAVAENAMDAIVNFEALERGTDGVVLRTEDPADIFVIKEYIEKRTGGTTVPLVCGQVTRVQPMGMGDRACVDLCCLLRPGEGMLVGSFARALFLVHSECLESDYVASRPFRVNAGPVHSYVAAPDGKTAYLSELQSGREVLVVDSQGQTRHVLVGRVKIESRPLMLVEAEADGQRHSIILQNAETVRLIGCTRSGGKDGKDDGRQPISVSKLKVGDKILLSIQESAARHTGIKVNEMINER